MDTQPNLYECSNKAANLKVDYATSSFLGQPTLSVEAGFREMGLQNSVSALGDSIETESTQLGTLVSVNAGYVPDYASYRYVLVLPTLRLTDAQHEVRFETQLVRVRQRTTIAGIPSGVSQDAIYTPVTCTASKVVF